MKKFTVPAGTPLALMPARNTIWNPLPDNSAWRGYCMDGCLAVPITFQQVPDDYDESVHYEQTSNEWGDIAP